MCVGESVVLLVQLLFRHNVELTLLVQLQWRYQCCVFDGSSNSMTTKLMPMMSVTLLPSVMLMSVMLMSVAPMSVTPMMLILQMMSQMTVLLMPPIRDQQKAMPREVELALA